MKNLHSLPISKIYFKLKFLLIILLFKRKITNIEKILYIQYISLTLYFLHPKNLLPGLRFLHEYLRANISPQ